LSEQQEIAGDFLVGAGRQQRVGSRQIHQFVAAAVVQESALGPRHRLARPISRVLAQSRQRVEHRALARVRIARQRDDKLGAVHADAHADDLSRVVRRSGCGSIQC
jgi:hypothetical protein